MRISRSNRSALTPEREIGREDLHHDFALEAQFLGDEHPPHAAAAELALEAVGVAERCLELGSQVYGQGTTSLWSEGAGGGAQNM